MKKLAPILLDAAGLLGFAMITAGVAMIYVPAGWIFGGGGLLAAALLMARKS
jgi:hypothetical protein